MTEKYYSEGDVVELINTLPIIAIVNGIVERFGPNMTETEKAVLLNYSENLRSSFESLVGEDFESLPIKKEEETLIGEEDKSILISNEGQENKDASGEDSKESKESIFT